MILYHTTANKHTIQYNMTPLLEDCYEGVWHIHIYLHCTPFCGICYFVFYGLKTGLVGFFIKAYDT